MIICNCDCTVGKFYEIYNTESKQVENALLTDIKVNISGYYATLLTFNGIYKTKNIESDVISPLAYVTQNEMLDMIAVIVEKTVMHEGFYLEEDISLIKMIITNYIASLRNGE